LPVPETPAEPRRGPGGTSEPKERGGPPGPVAAGTTPQPGDRHVAPGPREAGILWLVRHGESGWNVAGRIQGQSPTAPALTATGREQAAHAAPELARRAPRAPLIVASDLARATETAEIIADHLRLPVQFDPALREQSLGDLEGQSAFAPPEDQGGGGTEDILDAFWVDPFRTPPGGESVAEMYDRVRRALDRIAASYPGADLIIVTHGGPVRVATAARPPEPGRAFPRTVVGNASITPYRPPARRAAPHGSP
jgi:2,3-bisphosphoglycerate-dependent phosphoglycerate mutase